MKNKSNKDILRIVLIIFGGFFLFSCILCMGIIGSFFDTESQTADNSETKKISEDYKIENDTKSIIIKEKAKITVKETPTKKPTKKPTVKPTKKINMLDLQLKVLKKNFDEIADIKYKDKEKLIEIIPTNSSFMYEANQAYNQDQEALIIWNQLIENIKGISKEIDDKEICICIVNNINTENYLLMIMDGIVLYNFVDS